MNETFQTYLPFGESFIDQRNGYSSRYTFSAKEKDDETQYSYFGARYYDSDLSIFLSVDRYADKYHNLSPYHYCANNPINIIDINGDSTWYIYKGQLMFATDYGADCVVDMSRLEPVVNDMEYRATDRERRLSQLQEAGANQDKNSKYHGKDFNEKMKSYGIKYYIDDYKEFYNKYNHKKNHEGDIAEFGVYMKLNKKTLTMEIIPNVVIVAQSIDGGGYNMIHWDEDLDYYTGKLFEGDWDSNLHLHNSPEFGQGVDTKYNGDYYRVRINSSQIQLINKSGIIPRNWSSEDNSNVPKL